jgi:hypothetical protein
MFQAGITFSGGHSASVTGNKYRIPDIIAYGLIDDSTKVEYLSKLVPAYKMSYFCVLTPSSYAISFFLYDSNAGFAGE